MRSDKQTKIILTPREIEILILIILECTTSEIAEKLSLSYETIKTHRKHLFYKFNAKNVAGLVRRAFEHQIVSPSQLKRLSAVS